ncbi:PP2C family serine/threonine-protein phosphatase [Methylomicrobium lacus]|uniref:PP2C family serine/threonine-protein phosphatase n=1 Tax=Methylomicrobium lacus TaxID=136992 RepID=UPI0035A8455D
MTWRIVAASAVGTSHTVTGTACQDSCLAQVETDPVKPPLMTIFVADGAGSAVHGGIGAELAIEAATAFVGQYYAQSEFALNDHWAVECIQAVRAKIYAVADQQGAKARDYACTFLGVVSSPFATLLMQIGDGGIVVDIGNGLTVPITPMAGEYVNMTNFVTDENAIDVLAVATFPTRADKVAVFSDGIQRLALNMTTNTAHAPFFTPFFTVLATVTAAEEDYLHAELARFLQSPAVNERTDDDKTLALAHWVG